MPPVRGDVAGPAAARHAAATTGRAASIDLAQRLVEARDAPQDVVERTLCRLLHFAHHHRRDLRQHGLGGGRWQPRGARGAGGYAPAGVPAAEDMGEDGVAALALGRAADQIAASVGRIARVADRAHQIGEAAARQRVALEAVGQGVDHDAHGGLGLRGRDAEGGRRLLNGRSRAGPGEGLQNRVHGMLSTMTDGSA
jgi:hypothetical protein